MRVFDLAKDIYSDLDIRVRSFLWSLRYKCRDPRRANIWRYGFTVQEEYLSTSVCSLLRDELDALLSNPVVKIWRDECGSDNRIYGFESISEKIRQYIDIDQIKTLGEQYLGKRIVDYFVLGARLEAKEGNLGSGGGWHRDSAFSHQYKAIIYLDDVEPETGPFEYITGSHRNLNKWRDFFDTNLTQTRYQDSEISNNVKKAIVTLIAPVGSVIFVDTRGVHRGKPIDAGKRYALTFYFYTAQIPAHVVSQLQGAH